MTGKELLDKIIRLRKAIDYRNTKIEALIAQAENTSSRLTGMPHNPSPDHSPMATAVIKKIDLENEVTKLTAERDGLVQKIDLVGDDVLSRILNLRYAQEARWDEIMAEMCFSETHIHRLHRKAITILDEKLKEGS